ncbi:MAG TPA: NUDIX hydrolase [Gemmatimonadaceae bacterium]
MAGKKRASAPARRRRKRETSAGGVVMRMDGGRRLYLLIRDSHDNWGFPKGHVEAGERTESAAVREVAEETGVHELTVRAAMDPIQWMFTWHGALIHKTCHFFLMEASDAETHPQASEGIRECRWTGLDEALRLLRYDNARNVLRSADARASGAQAPSATPA